MAIQDDTCVELATVLGVSERVLTRRFRVWLWLTLKLESPSDHDFSSHVPTPDAIWQMAQYFKRRADKRQIPANRAFYFLPEEALAWIGEDDRQNQYLFRRLQMEFGIQEPDAQAIQSVLHGRDLVVGLIDRLNRELTYKQQQVAGLHKDWNDHLNLDKSIEGFFLKEDEAEKCSLMWEMTAQQYPAAVSGVLRFTDVNSMTLFFGKGQFTFEQTALLLSKLKKRWSQNKYRVNLKDKKQVNLVLSSKTIGLLDKMASNYDLSRAQILEALIQDESKKKIYLTERLSRRAALTSSGDF